MVWLFSGIDTDYDLEFFARDKLGTASLGNPFVLNTTSLTVGLWIRYCDSTGGTFFTLYGMK